MFGLCQKSDFYEVEQVRSLTSTNGISRRFSVYWIPMNVYVVLLLQTLTASATHIVAKSVVQDVDTWTLTFLRALISSGGLLLFVFWRGTTLRVERADYGTIAFLAVLATLNQLLYLYGMKFTTPANGALLYASTPVFVLLLSSYFLKERITPKKSAGIFLAFTGVVVVIFERGLSLSSEYNYGNLVILTAVTCWALFTIKVNRWCSNTEQHAQRLWRRS